MGIQIQIRGTRFEVRRPEFARARRSRDLPERGLERRRGRPVRRLAGAATRRRRAARDRAGELGWRRARAGEDSGDGATELEECSGRSGRRRRRGEGAAAPRIRAVGVGNGLTGPRGGGGGGPLGRRHVAAAAQVGIVRPGEFLSGGDGSGIFGFRPGFEMWGSIHRHRGS